MTLFAFYSLSSSPCSASPAGAGLASGCANTGKSSANRNFILCFIVPVCRHFKKLKYSLSYYIQYYFQVDNMYILYDVITALCSTGVGKLRLVSHVWLFGYVHVALK